MCPNMLFLRWDRTANPLSGKADAIPLDHQDLLRILALFGEVPGPAMTVSGPVKPPPPQPVEISNTSPTQQNSMGPGLTLWPRLHKTTY